MNNKYKFLAFPILIFGIIIITLSNCKKDNSGSDTITPDLNDTLWKSASDYIYYGTHNIDTRLITSPNDSIYVLSVNPDYINLEALNKSYYYGLKGRLQYSGYAAGFSPNGQFYYCSSIDAPSAHGSEMYWQRNSGKLSEGIDVMAFWGVNQFTTSHPENYMYGLAGDRNCIAFASDGLPVVFNSYNYNQTDSLSKVRLTALKFTGYNKWESKGTIDANTNSQIAHNSCFFISENETNKIAAVYTKANDNQSTVEIIVKENNNDTIWTQLGQSIKTANSKNVTGGYATDAHPVLIYEDAGSPGTIVRIRHWNGSAWENWGDQKFDSDMGGSVTAAYVDSKNQVWIAVNYFENGDPYNTKIAILRRNSNGQWLNVTRGMDVLSPNATYTIFEMAETTNGRFYIAEDITSNGISSFRIYKWSSKKW